MYKYRYKLITYLNNYNSDHHWANSYVQKFRLVYGTKNRRFGEVTGYSKNYTGSVVTTSLNGIQYSLGNKLYRIGISLP